MKTKKSLGQHFLKSERALNVIIATGKIIAGETVLEIGPGTGALTEKLLGAGCLVLAVEKDDELYEKLKIKYQNEINSGQLTLIHDDILKFDIALVDVRYKVVANIPYNITGAIIEKFLSAENQPKQMVLLVQKEVAKRIVDEKESILSISVKAYGKPKYIETVKAGSFTPAPSVDSAILSIENISKDFFNKFSEQDFFKILKAGFSSKRKKLSSNLSHVFDKKIVLNTFEKLNLDPNTRAEDLSVEKWGKLASFLVV